MTDQQGEQSRLSELESSLAALIERVAQLEISAESGSDQAGTDRARTDRAGTHRDGSRRAIAPSRVDVFPHDDPVQDGPYWALNTMREKHPPPGGVCFAGSVDVGSGHWEYQWERPTQAVRDLDWASGAERLAALAHPLRLAIMRLLVDGERTVAQLVDELELASTGVAYHHLNQLQGEGWVTSPRRGVWSVPGSRVVPLLIIITATEEA